jgi:hypothetical protein
LPKAAAQVAVQVLVQVLVQVQVARLEALARAMLPEQAAAVRVLLPIRRPILQEPPGAAPTWVIRTPLRTSTPMTRTAQMKEIKIAHIVAAEGQGPMQTHPVRKFGERWPSRLVATAAEDRLSFLQRFSFRSKARAVSDRERRGLRRTRS